MMRRFDNATDLRGYLAECGIRVPRTVVIESVAGNWFVALPDTVSCALVGDVQDALAGTNAHLGLAPLTGEDR